MKSIVNILKIMLITLIIAGCSSSDDDNPDNNDVYGTIQLSGNETNLLGNSLVVGNIDVDAFDTTGTNSSVVLLDENTTIENGELNPTDFNNAFVIVAAQFSTDDNATVNKAISITILKNGVEYGFVCSTPPTSSADNTDCGTGFSVDKVAKLIVFNNTTVINVDTEEILTMNGTINYN